MAKTIRKAGRASVGEELYINENMSSMSDEEIAKEIDRTPDFVKKVKAKYAAQNTSDEYDFLVRQLHSMYLWDKIMDSLLPSEVKLFEDEWANLCLQFQESGKLASTDYLMIKDYVLFEIFYHRSLSEIRKMNEELSEIDSKLKAEFKKDITDRDIASITNLQTQQNSLRAALNSKSSELIKYQEKKDIKLKDLKGTREARFKQHEEAGTTLFGVLKDLDSREQRIEQGRRAELMKMASDKVRKEWSQYHTYADGSIDRPFLTPEALEEEDKQDQEEKEGENEK